MSDTPQISILVPVYGSRDCLPELVARIEKAMAKMDRSFELVLTDDASPDNAWEVITALAEKYDFIVAQRHSKNFGNHNALMTALKVARGDIVVTMDDDLQHDPDDVSLLVDALEKQNADLVYAHFIRKSHSLVKKIGSRFNGLIAQWLLAKPKDVYLSPFRAARGNIIRNILRYNGPDPYIDGLLLETTRNIRQIDIQHHERHAGTGNFTLRRSIKLWSRLVFSFSVRPLRISTWMGLSFAFVGFCGVAVILADRLLLSERIPKEALGWASLMTAFLVFSGIQMVVLGIIGEYLGRLHININNAPQSVVSEQINVETK